MTASLGPRHGRLSGEARPRGRHALDARHRRQRQPDLLCRQADARRRLHSLRLQSCLPVPATATCGSSRPTASATCSGNASTTTATTATKPPASITTAKAATSSAASRLPGDNADLWVVRTGPDSRFSGRRSGSSFLLHPSSFPQPRIPSTPPRNCASTCRRPRTISLKVYRRRRPRSHHPRGGLLRRRRPHDPLPRPRSPFRSLLCPPRHPHPHRHPQTRPPEIAG